MSTNSRTTARPPAKRRPGPPAKVEPGPPAKLTWEELNALVDRAKKGDRKSYRQLREALGSGDYPAERTLWGDPAEWLKLALAKSLWEDENDPRLYAVTQTMERMQRELEGPNPTPLERLLVERVVFCWFSLTLAEMNTALAASQQQTYTELDYKQRRDESSNRRFNAAVKTLARVRAMALPALQVNVGTNQVNVAGTVPPGDGW